MLAATVGTGEGEGGGRVHGLTETECVSYGQKVMEKARRGEPFILRKKFKKQCVPMFECSACFFERSEICRI